MGEGKWGQLGHGDTKNIYQPKSIELLKGINVISIACGWKHTGLVTVNADVFMFGNGNFGQLGLGQQIKSSLVPKKLQLTGDKPHKICCCSSSTFLLCSNGHLWCFGRNQFGQLGLGTMVDQYSPQYLEIANVKEISCGSEHTIILTEQGRIYTFGWGEHNQLGIENKDNQLQPKELKLEGFEVIMIACGGAHCIIDSLEK